MFLIVGLGNPGKEYEHTRHNVGFDVIDVIAKNYNIEINKSKFKGMYGIGKINEEKVLLLKPYTYMNLSGESVREAMDFYKINKEEIVVLYDDISLDVGRIRIRKKGSAGGHNGIKNIIAHLGSDTFTRIKIGVGQSLGDLVSHVLGRFTKEDRKLVEKTFDVATKAVEIIVESEVDEAMNKYNGFKAEA